MRFAVDVAFEAVFVTTLLFAGLAVPAEALKAFRFELVADVLERTDFGFRHLVGSEEEVRSAVVVKVLASWSAE